MTTLTAIVENWDWADELFNGSEFADTFDVEDCSFDPDCKVHFYFDSSNKCVAVTPEGEVTEVVGWFDDDEPIDLEACPGCGCKPGDGITPDCNHPDGCGFEY